MSYQERPGSPLSRITYPTDAIVLRDTTPVFNDAGTRVSELNAGQTVEVRGMYSALILNDTTGVMNYYYRLDENRIVCSRDILLRSFSGPSAGSTAAKIRIISNPVGLVEDGACRYELWLETNGKYKRLGDTLVGDGASAVSLSGNYFFIKKYETGTVKVFSSSGDQLWDGESASPALYSPAWVDDTLFMRGRAEFDAVYSLNPATKELKRFLNIPDGKGIADVHEETTDEAGEETFLWVYGEPVREENGLLKIVFKRVSDQPPAAEKPVMIIDVTADKGGKIVKKQVAGWISFEELKASLRK